MKSKEQILLLAKKNFKPAYLLGWLRFFTYDELQKLDLLEPYDCAYQSKQVKTIKDWDNLVIEYNKQNLLSGLCILMRKLFNAIIDKNWIIASIYADDIQNWLYILDDDFKFDGSINSENILNYYKDVSKKYKIDF